MLPKIATKKQREVYEYGMRHPYSIWAVDARLGKAQPVDSIVYCPEGPRKIGDLIVGDTVLGQDGKPKKVTGVFPQGIKKIYRSFFSDGSSTNSCGEHLWSVKNGNDRARGKPPRVLDTKYILDSLSRGRARDRWFIDMAAPAKFIAQENMIPPYTLGILIGDGSLNHGTVSFTNASTHIFKRVSRDVRGRGIIAKRIANPGRSVKISLTTTIGKANPWIEEIRRLGLNVLSKNKFIPAEYKIDSIQNRIELLRGLLDTDGYVAKDGTVQFTSASERLCDDVRWIVQSLGGVARKNYKLSKCQTGSFDSWTITINIPKGITPVTKPFKLNRYAPKDKFKASRKFIKIVPSGKKECVCISVEGELYLTDEFIVTHNTLVAIAVQQTLKNNCLVICPSYLTSNWKKEILKWAKKGTQITVFKKGSEIYEPCDSDFVVISYDLVQKADHLFEWADMLVCDEVHHLKSIAAKRTQFIHKQIYENSVPRVHLLSGTILKNRVQEHYSPLAIMYYSPHKEKIKGAKDFGTFIKVDAHKSEPKFLDRFEDEISFADYFSFRREYKVRVTDKRGRTYSMAVAKWEGLRNVAELKKYRKGKYIRVKATNKDLPPVSYKRILISESKDQALLDAFDSYFNEEGTGSVRPDIKVAAAMKKVPFTIKYVEDLLTSVECVLVYSDHVEPIKAIAAHFKVPAITSKTMTAKKRSILADEFQAGKGTILCATIGCLKEGKDLFRSKDIVFNDLCWVSGDMRQVINRVRGLGEKEPRSCHFMFGSPQDEKIWDALEEKQRVIDRCTN